MHRRSGSGELDVFDAKSYFSAQPDAADGLFIRAAVRPTAPAYRIHDDRGDNIMAGVDVYVGGAGAAGDHHKKRSTKKMSGKKLAAFLQAFFPQVGSKRRTPATRDDADVDGSSRYYTPSEAPSSVSSHYSAVSPKSAAPSSRRTPYVVDRRRSVDERLLAGGSAAVDRRLHGMVKEVRVVCGDGYVGKKWVLVNAGGSDSPAAAGDGYASDASSDLFELESLR